MYNCQVCGKTSKPGMRQNVIIASTRQVEHPYRAKANWIKIEDKWEGIDDEGGVGTQIRKELRVCEDCKTFSPEIASAETLNRMGRL